MKKLHDDSSPGQTRREFVSSSALSVAAILGSFSTPNTRQRTLEALAEGQAVEAEFTFGEVYSRQEARSLLRPSKAPTPTSPPRVGLPFWWDKEANMLVNPTNNRFDTKIKPGDYRLNSTVLNFRASKKELGDVWRGLTNNAQLNINAGSVSSEGDPLQWIVMTGINIAQNIFSNKDGQLAPLTQNNKPTDSLRPAEAVVFKQGICTMGITLSAQKKKSVWDKLLALVKAFANSTVFGMLPIPKLYQTAIQGVTASLNQIRDQSKLIRVLGGNSYNYKLYDGANSEADLIFRPGHWVVLDSEFAAAHMDGKSNLAGIYLDIPGLLYQLKDSSNQLVDTTYTVAELDLTQVSGS